MTEELKNRLQSRYSSRYDFALGFAAQQHAEQKRKGTGLPYVVHPVHVARLLDRYGFDEDVVIGGLLHDVLEDTDCSAETLTDLFGTRVTEMVVAVTEPDKSAPWEVRKSGAVERMRTMSPDAKAVACADKAHNLHTIADALERGESQIWARFKRGRQQQMAYHEQALAALSTDFTHPIVDELRLALARLAK